MRISLIMLFVGGIGLAQPLAGQPMVPDTSLNYETFLNECINFKQTQGREAWVVFFWASWNSKSLYDLPQLQNLKSAYANKPIRFVSVSEDKEVGRWVNAIRQYEIPGEHLIVPRTTQLSNLKRAFPYNSLPGIFLVSRDGKVWHPYTMSGLRDLLEQESRFLPNTPYYTDEPSSSRPPVNTGSIDDPFPQDPAPQPNDPVPPAEDPLPPANDNSGEWLIHVVQRGETLYRLQVKYGVPVEEIKRINGLSNNNIDVGQEIRIRRQ